MATDPSKKIDDMLDELDDWRGEQLASPGRDAAREPTGWLDRRPVP